MHLWHQSGPHSYYTDGNLVFWRMVDVMDEVHIQYLLAAVDAVLAQFEQGFLLVDCSQAHGINAEARRRYADWLKNSPYSNSNRASIFFAVNAEMRAFLTLAKRGAQLASGKRSSIEVVDDETAARVRVEELRASWASPQGPSVES